MGSDKVVIIPSSPLYKYDKIMRWNILGFNNFECKGFLKLIFVQVKGIKSWINFVVMANGRSITKKTHHLFEIFESGGDMVVTIWNIGITWSVWLNQEFRDRILDLIRVWDSS